MSASVTSSSIAANGDGALHDAVRELLIAAGVTYTSNRHAIVEVLLSAGPLTLPEILHERKDLAQSSAYRNLSVLVETGVVRRIVHDHDHARFELDEQLTGHHHHHLVCSQCGLVVDVDLPMALEQELDRALERVATRSGFTLDGHDPDIRGKCTRCCAPVRS